MSTDTTKPSQDLRNDIYRALAQSVDITNDPTTSTQNNTNSDDNHLHLAAWWLLGTSACHLCEQAQETLRLFCGVYGIHYQVIDIAKFNERLMMQFADKIPVLLTPQQRLDYPFSIADLQQLILNKNQ
ncbi:glutaredoxin family protein [Psychrobacter sp. I-STPA10]|uniref:glutaredoxin family protein n=1 Tax=Psychrobacter sp. I-STPA10 TaxID=2585769 RepID=UPI001E435AA8|nr:glutaredoxin family protein [Psychrobacter sp. I-STPA10]